MTRLRAVRPGIIVGFLTFAGTARLAAQANSPAAQLMTQRIADAEPILSTLVESYGVSGMEAPVRETITKLLPSWAKAETDSAGNLWVRAGSGEPQVVFVAHMDEIGYRVTAIREDGTLDLERVGGFITSLFEGRPALVHTGSRTRASTPCGDSVDASLLNRLSRTRTTRAEPVPGISVADSARITA